MIFKIYTVRYYLQYSGQIQVIEPGGGSKKNVPDESNSYKTIFHWRNAIFNATIDIETFSLKECIDLKGFKIRNLIAQLSS